MIRSFPGFPYPGQDGQSWSNYGYSSPMPTNMASDTYAQDTRAWLAREDWNDYKSRFQPFEKELVDSVTGTELLDQRLSAITANNNKAYDVANMNANVMRGRYGVQQGSQQQAIQDNTQDLRKRLGHADAMNNTRTHVYDRNMNTLSGGAGDMRGNVQSGYGG